MLWGWTYDQVHVYVCVPIWERDQENSYLKNMNSDRKNRWKLWTFFMFPLFKAITNQKKHCHMTQNTATPLGNDPLRNSLPRSQRHMPLPELKALKQPTLRIKFALRHFNDFFRTCHGLRKSLFPYVQPAEQRHFENMLPHGAPCTLCFLARGNCTLANWLTLVC